MSNARLHGRRVLLVEDNGAQAREYGKLLRQAGAEVVGPAKSIASAKDLIAAHEPAAAWLDVSLDDDAKVWPVASLLERCGIPFLFCTSAPEEVEPAKWPGRPIVGKPRTQQAREHIVTLLANLMDGPPKPSLNQT